MTFIVKQQFRYADESPTEPITFQAHETKEEAALYATSLTMRWLMHYPKATHNPNPNTETWVDSDQEVAMDIWVVEKK